MSVKTHVAAPGWTNSHVPTAKPVPKERVVCFLCVHGTRGGAGLGAVHHERGGQTWQKKTVYLHKHSHKSHTNNLI